jgi:prolipoprotein diacylglyceryltransferase
MPNELIHLRIGSWILHADAVILPVAGLVFAVLAYRALWPALTESPAQARFIVATICLGGILGARLYGLFQPYYAGEPILADGAWRDLRFGSLGGMWGIFLASGVAAKMTRKAGVLAMWDSIVPAIALSAAIARIACVFQGCCAGVPSGLLAAIANPIYAWPFLDIAALLIALYVAHVAAGKWCHAGVQTAVFIGVYGLLRFGAEIHRDTYTATGTLTWGQLFVITQILFAVGLVANIRFRVAERPSHT